METRSVTGLVIREKRVSEADRLVWILTDEVGVIKAFVPNALKINSKFLSATQLLSYSKLYIKPTKDETFRISDAKPINVFFGLRKDVRALALCGYMCELASTLAPKDEEAHEFLGVALNSAHLLSENIADFRLIKAVFELKFCCLAGYMPDISGCVICGETESDSFTFNCNDGIIYCGECDGGGRKISKSVLMAMRHIVESDRKRAFAFSLGDQSLDSLCAVCEEFVISQTERHYKTLDFYKEL